MHSSIQQKRGWHSLPTAKKNEAWAPPPGLLSSVFVCTVHQVIVQSDEVADKCCGAQPRASTPR